MPRYFLILNIGSTSVKSRLFDDTLQLVSALNTDYGVNKGLTITGHDAQGNNLNQQYNDPYDARAALRVVLELWQKILSDNQLSLTAIGHRIVHGADIFREVTRLNHDVLKQIERLDAYAPLHNPLNHLGVTMAEKTFPAITQFAVFDTAFHHQIPDYARRYAIPEQLSPNVQFHRYGFHGISCQHSVNAAANFLGKEASQLNLIILHLGGGASATAVKNGHSIDTSMGFSPTEGLMMASRCGDLDSMILITLQKEGMSWQQVDNLINHRSGLLAVCGETDMRQIIDNIENQHPESILALDMFCYRIKKYIGAYTAVLGEVSALVFTGGIGEHSALVRSKVLAGLEPIGLSLDQEINRTPTQELQDIGIAGKHCRVLVIPAEEEREIAKQILKHETAALRHS